jgi:hypothetical protein
MYPTVPLSVFERFATTLEWFYRAVAARSKGGAMTGAMIMLVCGRIVRVERRIEVLLARIQAGLLPVARLKLARVTKAECRDGREAAAAAVRLPRGFGWLLALVPCEAANLGSQLRHTLADPEMVGLLAASQQTRRVLAPLCRMLAIEKAVPPPPAAAPDAASAGSEALVPEVGRTRDCPGLACRLSTPGQTSLAPDCPAVRDG